MPADADTRSRRSVIAGALGGAAALLAGRFSSPDAAAGSPLIVGSETNNSGTKDTQLIANSNVATFKLYQTGPGTALMGYTTTASGPTRGVYGRVDSPNGDGVQGRNAGGAGTGAAVRAYGGHNVGLRATSDTADAIAGTSPLNTGVRGSSTSGNGVVGVSISDSGVIGASTSLFGVYGISTNDTGVYGTSGDGTGIGVHGYSSGGSGTYGESSTGMGLRGLSNTYLGVYGQSTTNAGVWGQSTSGLGVSGRSTSGTGVYGESAEAVGVYGTSSGIGGWAGYFQGDTHVNGNLSKSGGSFRIDHPIDPAGKYLSHSFVESPDMLNVYNGNTTLDGNGEATVSLPAWFEALNRDFRYQLTSIGPTDRVVYVKDKLNGNAFSIAGGNAATEVSWQVTGIRQDAYANAHRIKVEETKTGGARGKYLHPELFGKLASESVQPRPEATLARPG